MEASDHSPLHRGSFIGCTEADEFDTDVTLGLPPRPSFDDKRSWGKRLKGGRIEPLTASVYRRRPECSIQTQTDGVCKWHGSVLGWGHMP